MDYLNVINEMKEGKYKDIYLFFGEEQYLCENTVKLLENTIINPIYKDFNYEYMEGSYITTEAIENACETLPFMDEKRLVIIKNFDCLQGNKRSKENEEKQDELATYIENIPQNTCLVFWQTTGIDRRKKIFKGIKKYGEIVEFNKLNPNELSHWIEKMVGKKEKSISKAEIKYFIENNDYLSKNSKKTLRDIENELNKIIDYIGERKKINKEDIKKIIPKKLDNDIFKMVDAIGKKERSMALKLLRDMLKEGENEMMILSMIVRQYRILLQCKELRSKGYSPNEIASKIEVHPFVVKKGLSQSQYFTSTALKDALYYALEMDQKIKLGKIDQRLGLEMLIFQNMKDKLNKKA